jgi:3-oxoacyl-[acyl-carrier-protein] synthase-3
MATITPPQGSPHARILGVGGYRPSRIVTNAEICERIDSSDEWIRERSGIESRRWAAPDETVIDMSLAAAGKAIAHAGLQPEQIRAVIVATVTHPLQTPSAAAKVADRLGATDAAAFDVSAACAGFCYGVSMANDMVRGGSAEHVLVIGCEKLSDFTDSYDRSTAFIFGDGAGAVVVGPSDEPAIGPTIWGSDGSEYEAITQRASWIDVRDHNVEFPTLTMQGQKVFRWAVWQMAPVARRALEAAGITADDLDAFIPHQANARIVDAMVKTLAMERMLEAGEVKSGGLALLIGFGAGLVYAAQVVRLP